jgi:hypothetical protein
VRRGATALTALAALALCVCPAAARAQRAPTPARVVPELRLDGGFGRDDAGLLGAGAFLDAGLYTRVGLVVAAGLARVPGVAAADGDAGVVPVGRVEALARFHLDPQRLSRRGVYAGGGLAVAVREASAPRYQLVGLLGLEGAARGGLAPAVEVGLGGGLRVALALRRARPGRR